MRVVIQEEDFDVQEEYARLVSQSEDPGALVLFVGRVREFSPGLDNGSKQRRAGEETSPSIVGLKLEHYPEMTESLIEETICAAKTRFDLMSARVIHRVGTLSAHEQIVLVATSSAHRESAFDGAQFIMDYLKTTATLWKKELTTNGGAWLGVKEKDRVAANRWELNKADI